MINKLSRFILTAFCVLSAAEGHSQAVVLNGEEPDTINQERYDDYHLRNLIGSTTTVPFFHHTERRFWYSWQEAGQKPVYKVWDARKGSYRIENTDSFDTYKYPAVNPYGTSPDSLYRLYTDEKNNLWVENIRTKAQHKLTEDGEEDYTFELADMKWLDGDSYIVPRKDLRGVRKFHLVYSLSTPPMDYAYDYELPGDTIVEHTTFYFGKRDSSLLRLVNTDRWPCQEITLQKADGVSDRIFFWRKKRTRDIAELCTIDKDGVLAVILRETDHPRINPDLFSCTVTNKGKDIFLISDRSGWGQIYHYNAKGQLVGAVTKGAWTVGRILAADDAHRTLYFVGYGREKDVNPYYSLVYRVGYDGRNLRLLTPEKENHNVFVSTSLDLLVDCHSRIDKPTEVTVRDLRGKYLSTIEKTDASKLLAYGWKYPEPFTVKAADDSTLLYGVMWKPYDFDPAKKYPVISQVYPGPFTETVWNDFTVFDHYHNAALAQRGFIVVVFGHRGSSPYRSKAYNVYGYGNLRDYALADDKAGLEHLAAKYPFIDLRHVGIVGHSGGGFMAATAIMTYPDFYKAAVASSGNYDNRIYHRSWGENYQGISGDKAAFSVKTTAELAGRLKGHLLLVTGDADQNVHPANTQRLVEALIQANKDFDLLVLPGQDHHYDAIHQQYFERRKRDFFEKWLKEK